MIDCERVELILVFHTARVGKRQKILVKIAMKILTTEKFATLITEEGRPTFGA